MRQPSASWGNVRGKSFEQFLADPLLRDAVERRIEIIGEAARGVSEQTRQTLPDIPWRAIIVQRHRLSHEYGSVDHRLIWDVATIHAPRLAARLAPLVQGGQAS